MSIITFLGYYFKKIHKKMGKEEPVVLTLDELIDFGRENSDFKVLEVSPLLLSHLPDGLDPWEKIFFPLVAALKQTSLAKTYHAYLNDLLNSDDPDKVSKAIKVLENSLGAGHNAAADLIQFQVSGIFPRIFTIFTYLGEYGVRGLQKSTRRVEHDSYLIPSSITTPELKNEYIDLMKKVQGVFNGVLNKAGDDKDRRKELRELAMYVQPLSLLTTNDFQASLRALWSLFVESGITSNSKGDLLKIEPEDGVDDYNSILFDYSSIIFKELRKISYLLVRKWSTNYNPMKLWPRTSFFSTKNEDLERIINENINTLRQKSVVVLSHNDPLRYTKLSNDELDIKSLVSNSMDNLKMGGVDLLVFTDLSLLHELIRHRTVRKQIEPLVVAADRTLNRMKNMGENYDYKDFYFPKIVRENKDLLDKFKLTYKELLLFYEKLVNEGVPKQDAVIVLPHGLKVTMWLKVDFWNLVNLSGERMCYTAKSSIRTLFDRIKESIKEYESRVGINNFMSSLMHPKCYYLGKCPDVKSSIKNGLVKNGKIICPRKDF